MGRRAVSRAGSRNQIPGFFFSVASKSCREKLSSQPRAESPFFRRVLANTCLFKTDNWFESFGALLQRDTGHVRRRSANSRLIHLPCPRCLAFVCSCSRFGRPCSSHRLPAGHTTQPAAPLARPPCSCLPKSNSSAARGIRRPALRPTTRCSLFSLSRAHGRLRREPYTPFSTVASNTSLHLDRHTGCILNRTTENTHVQERETCANGPEREPGGGRRLN
jgi:hypothetical protein